VRKGWQARTNTQQWRQRRLLSSLPFNIMLEQYAHEIVVLFLFGFGVVLFYLGLKDVDSEEN
jgi:hypothetical protein